MDANIFANAAIEPLCEGRNVCENQLVYVYACYFHFLLFGIMLLSVCFIFALFNLHLLLFYFVGTSWFVNFAKAGIGK